MPQDPRDDEDVRTDEASIGQRIMRAIRQSISGAGKDVNLPDENPNKGTPADAGRVAKHAARQHTQTMDRLQDFGRKISSNPGVQDEIRKAKERAGKSNLAATREAMGVKDEDDDE